MHHRYSVAMEAAMSTKPVLLKLSSILDTLFDIVPFS